eukprot:2312189-Ditylum_brightwellii.AAC.1
MKAAVLRGDSWAPDIIFASCYDQKPFIMISSMATEVTWQKVFKQMTTIIYERQRYLRPATSHVQ